MNFDLNIANYSVDELFEMFDIMDRRLDVIDAKEYKLIERVNRNQHVSADVKRQTCEFISKAKAILLRNSISTHTTSVANEPYLGINKVESVPTFNSEFYKGTINPLKKRILKKNLTVDTRFRDNYYATVATNFNLQLPMKFENVVQMQLEDIEIPASYNAIRADNNSFSMTIDSTSLDVVVPEGNYTSQELIDIINVLIVDTGVVFVNVNSGRCLVQSSGISSLELSFTSLGNAVPLPLKLGWMLGFRSGKYVGKTEYLSEGKIDVVAPKYGFLVIDDYNNSVNNNFFGAFHSSLLNKNILARINFLKSIDNIVAPPREYFGPVDIQTMNIQLLDEYGRVIDLQNMDFSFCISMITSYDV